MLNDSLSINSGITMNQVMNDPEFWRAYANNMQMQALRNQTNSNTLTTQQPQAADSTLTAGNNGVPFRGAEDSYNTTPDYSENGNTSGLAKVGITVGLSAAALLTAAAFKGGGIKPSNIKQGLKDMWGWAKNLFGKGKKAITQNTAVENTLEKLKIVKTENGMQYFIPGKTTTIDSGDVLGQAKNMLPEKELKQLMNLRKNNTQILSGKFKVGEYFVDFKDGKITDVYDRVGKITSKFIDSEGKYINLTNIDDQKIFNQISERLKSITDGDWKVITGKDTALSNFTYKTTIGDNVATVFREGIAKTPSINPKIELQSLTTLKPFNGTEDDFLAYVRDNSLQAIKDLKSVTLHLI